MTEYQNIASRQVGPQQGDPMGPLLFGLTIQPILQSQLAVGYLDDLTAGGEQGIVASDFMMIIEEAVKLGLRLNPGKCEIITNDPLSLPAVFGDFIIQSPLEGSLLGAPLLVGSAMSQLLEARCMNLERALA